MTEILLKRQFPNLATPNWHALNFFHRGTQFQNLKTKAYFLKEIKPQWLLKALRVYVSMCSFGLGSKL